MTDVLTPTKLLEDYQDDIAEAKALLLVVVDKDDRLQVLWSSMTNAMMAMAALTVTTTAQSAVKGDFET